jgi:hypothetical protein
LLLIYIILHLVFLGFLRFGRGLGLLFLHYFFLNIVRILVLVATTLLVFGLSASS